MEAVFIRHTSVDVPSGTFYGQTDVPLRPSFPEEAAETCRRLDPYKPFDRVYTSPLSRCTRLAAFCGYSDAVRDVRLMELNFGDWEMKKWDEIRDPRLQTWFGDWLNTPATGGESFKEQYGRVASFLDELKRTGLHKAAVFTHGGVIACANVYAGRCSFEEAFRHHAAYGEIVPLTL